MLEKEEVCCWTGAERAGRRKVGGSCAVRCAFRSPLILGRMTEDVDMVRWQLAIAVVAADEACELSKYFEA